VKVIPRHTFLFQVFCSYTVLLVMEISIQSLDPKRSANYRVRLYDRNSSCCEIKNFRSQKSVFYTISGDCALFFFS
jgi:hypothetical protein